MRTEAATPRHHDWAAIQLRVRAAWSAVRARQAAAAGRSTRALAGMPASLEGANTGALRVVKAIHTVVWAVFAGCIVALPIAVWRNNLRASMLLIAIVTIEVLVLVANGLRCPLTGIAARYTQDRQDNFDIYLPLWLARYNKQIFGTLFAAGAVYAALKWRGMRGL